MVIKIASIIMNMNEIKAVIFDIDGTITPDISWLAMTRDLGASVEEHKTIFKAFKEGQISYETSKEQLIKLWQETGHATRPKLENIFESWPIFPEAEELVSFLHNKGFYVAFITGSMNLYAKVMAKKFSVLDYYASGELIFDNEENLIDFHFPHDESHKKLEHLFEFCGKRSLEPHNIVVIGDSENDVGLFSETKKGIMVGIERPDTLRKVAWKEIDNLSEIKELLAPFLSN